MSSRAAIADLILSIRDEALISPSSDNRRSERYAASRSPVISARSSFACSERISGFDRLHAATATAARITISVRRIDRRTKSPLRVSHDCVWTSIESSLLADCPKMAQFNGGDAEPLGRWTHLSPYSRIDEQTY